MKFQQQKGISPIIATLLLIAIAVAASIIVYVFVNSLAGGLTQGGGAQTTERLQMQSYNFALSPTGCGCTGQVLEMFLLNSGSSSTSVSAVYFDGTLMTLSTPTTTNTALSGINNNAYTAPVGTTVNDLATTACTAGGSVAATICFTAPTTDTSYASGTVGQVVITFSAPVTAGTSHTVKVVSSTGATFVFAVTSGRSG
jgi:archaeal type IV pilus assembly protein PilA